MELTIDLAAQLLPDPEALKRGYLTIESVQAATEIAAAAKAAGLPTSVDNQVFWERECAAYKKWLDYSESIRCSSRWMSNVDRLATYLLSD